VAGLKVVPVVKPAEVLALLNLKRVDKATLLKVEHYYEDFVASNRDSGADVKRLFRSFNVSQPAEFERRIIAIKLSQCVDEWLETGWTEDGGESPEHRSLIKAPLAMKALQNYASKQNPRLCFLQVPSEFVVEVGLPEDHRQTGATSAFVDPIDRVRSDVARLFFGLITSDWGPLLCKCRYCGRYFVHAKARPWYKHGTFCNSHHQMSWNAMRRGKEKRRLIHSALLDIAATELMKRLTNGSQWQDDTTSKIQLAKNVSIWIQKKGDASLQPLRSRVTLTWVTRNRQEIEKRRLELGSISPKKVQPHDNRAFLETVGPSAN
jgi:hypothetical protein